MKVIFFYSKFLKESSVRLSWVNKRGSDNEINCHFVINLYTWIQPVNIHAVHMFYAPTGTRSLDSVFEGGGFQERKCKRLCACVCCQKHSCNSWGWKNLFLYRHRWMDKEREREREVVKLFLSTLSFVLCLIPSLDHKLLLDTNTKWHRNQGVLILYFHLIGSYISPQSLIPLLLQTLLFSPTLLPLLSVLVLLLPRNIRPVFLSRFLSQSVFHFLLLTSLSRFKLIYGRVLLLCRYFQEV